ncbi:MULTISPECIES: transposase [Streptomyces]|uniref:HTH-like domain-containing protein n=2 Tax=Streptomyces TaxID=1883 RepID=A0ABD5JSV3_9ACTN|nr:MULTISPECIES: transposase [unclassified Streptomyces]MEE4590159.1 hypothetical protein [Streptomyces sp. DSM 41602]WTA78620.1 hypothetical protein OG751_00540 [Streptomyces antimycoticus]QTI87323.1 transposase [Streptomyces sp. AgN23]RSS32197.1 transposase [Streptomyces sp. WAC05858]WTB02865.1 hypothetical protein OG546_00450 [Streptomyces antimycoticus]
MKEQPTPAGPTDDGSRHPTDPSSVNDATSFRSSGGAYGSPKVLIKLVRRGWRVSVNTVAKLMAGRCHVN